MYYWRTRNSFHIVVKHTASSSIYLATWEFRRWTRTSTIARLSSKRRSARLINKRRVTAKRIQRVHFIRDSNQRWITHGIRHKLRRQRGERESYWLSSGRLWATRIACNSVYVYFTIACFERNVLRPVMGRLTQCSLTTNRWALLVGRVSDVWRRPVSKRTTTTVWYHLGSIFARLASPLLADRRVRGRRCALSVSFKTGTRSFSKRGDGSWLGSLFYSTVSSLRTRLLGWSSHGVERLANTMRGRLSGRDYVIKGDGCTTTVATETVISVNIYYIFLREKGK